MFEVKFVNENANAEFLALPTRLKAKMAHTILLLQDFGTLGEPHSKKLQDGLFELRVRAAEGIARAIYSYEKGRVILILAVFVKKSQKTPPNALKTAKQRLKDFKNAND